MLAATPATAQVTQGPLLEAPLPLSFDRGRNTSVLERARPEYEALGLRAGSFLVSPRIATGIGFSSNVLAAEHDAKADGFVTLDPSIAIQSDWAQNAFSVSGGASIRRFLDISERNETGLRLASEGRLDLTSRLQLFPSASIQRAYEQPTSAGFPTDARGLVRYVAATAALRGVLDASRSRASAMVDAKRLNFSDTTALNGSVIDQDFRDRTEVRFSAQYEYALRPDFAIYGQASHTVIDYPSTGGAANPIGDAQETRGVIGASFDLAALLRGRAAIGYERRSFQNAAFDPIAGVSVEARLEYFPSTLTTVSLNGRRSIEDGVLPGSNAYFLNSASVRVDHEFLRNLLANAQLTYEIDDFKGFDRTDKVAAGQLGVNYFVSSRWGLASTASYIRRSSSGTTAGQIYNELRVMFSLIVQR